MGAPQGAQSQKTNVFNSVYLKNCIRKATRSAPRRPELENQCVVLDVYEQLYWGGAQERPKAPRARK